MKIIRSFRYAFQGLFYAAYTQLNFRFHLVAAILAIVMGYFFHVSVTEWVWIGLVIAMVISAELFNTAVERVVDLVSPQWNDKAKQAKDLSAAAVLVIAIIAFVIGMVIFVPKIF